MKKLFLITLLIGNVAFAKVGSLVTGALVGGVTGLLIGSSGGGSSTTHNHNYSQLNVYECNCRDVKCIITPTRVIYRSVTKYGTCEKNNNIIFYSMDTWPVKCNNGQKDTYFNKMPYYEDVLVEFPANTAQIIYKQDMTKPIGCELIK